MNVSALVQALSAALERYPSVGLAVLFGSRAGLGAHPGSDVDVALAPLPGKDLSLDEELRIQHALSLATHLEVDVVRLDNANPIVRREIARQGKVLIERTGGAWARFASSALLEYLDMDPLLEAGRKRYLRRVALGPS